MPSEGRFSSLVDQVYRAASENNGWQRFAECLSRLLPAASVSLLAFDSERKRYGIDVNVGMPAEAQHIYNQYYGARDPWYLRAKGRVTANWVGDGRILCPREELRRTGFFNDFLRHYGWEHECAAVLETSGTAMAVMALLRRSKDEEFSAADLKLIRMLVPHVQRGLELHRRMVDIEGTNSVQAWALDQVPLGIVILSRSGRVLLANRAAREMCVPANGLRLTANSLHANVPREDGVLQAMVRSVLAPAVVGTKGGCMSVIRQRGNPLRLQIAPLADGLLSVGAGVAIFISDPDGQRQSMSSVLKSLFGLTDAEARVASGLAQDRSLAELADEFGVTYQTLRSQLKSIFQKTNTSRQAQLVRLLLLLPITRRQGL
jgi:DNA-binding CsgD family transcriptional regulator